MSPTQRVRPIEKRPSHLLDGLKKTSRNAVVVRKCRLSKCEKRSASWTTTAQMSSLDLLFNSWRMVDKRRACRGVSHFGIFGRKGGRRRLRNAFFSQSYQTTAVIRYVRVQHKDAVVVGLEFVVLDALMCDGNLLHETTSDLTLTVCHANEEYIRCGEQGWFGTMYFSKTALIVKVRLRTLYLQPRRASGSAPLPFGTVHSNAHLPISLHSSN